MSEPQPPQSLSGRSQTEVVRVPFVPSAWRLVWRDEFDHGPALSEGVWNHEEGYLRNAELQYYTNRRENSRIENGKLIIEARKDDYKGHKITSASVTTQGKKSFLYGRIEVRAKIPSGLGTWPAIWMLGENITKVDWPKCGEIDIMENVGYDPDRIHANVHMEAYNHTKGTGKGNSIVRPRPYDGFHVYAVEWSKDRMDFFYDDERYFSFANEGKGDAVWPFDKPQYLILNVAFGGAWGGSKGVDETKLPHRMEVDYVRYYQRK